MMGARQRGVALMAVLLIFAVLAALAVRMSGNHALLVAQSRNHFETDMALNYALGAEELARQALFMDFETDKDIDHLGEVWAQALPPFEVDEGGYIEVQVRDLDGCFNVNTLADSAPAREMFGRMLLAEGLPPTVMEVFRDWVDGDSTSEGLGGAEDNEYLLLDPAYRTANQPMRDISEIQLLANLDQEQKAKLLGMVCVSPSSTLAFNVNTAPVTVLAALKDGVNPDQLVEPEGTVRQYTKTEEFIDAMQAFDHDDNLGGLMKVTSQHFRIEVHAQVGQAVTILSSLASRDPDSGVVTIHQRNFGRDFTSRVAFAAEEEG